METMTRMQLFREHTIVTGRFGNLLETCLHCYHSVETRVKTGFLQVLGSCTVRQSDEAPKKRHKQFQQLAEFSDTK